MGTRSNRFWKRCSRPADGQGILVDRVWPRGIGKENLGISNLAQGGHQAPNCANGLTSYRTLEAIPYSLLQSSTVVRPFNSCVPFASVGRLGFSVRRARLSTTRHKYSQNISRHFASPQPKLDHVACAGTMTGYSHHLLRRSAAFNKARCDRFS